MRRQDSIYVAMCLGTIAFAVMFVAPMITEQAVAWYYPLERAWRFEPAPLGLAMDFYGRLVLGVIAWAIVVIVSLAITRRLESLSARMTGLLVAWTTTIALLVIAHFAWNLYFRNPMPEPIPSWYTPR